MKRSSTVILLVVSLFIPYAILWRAINSDGGLELWFPMTFALLMAVVIIGLIAIVLGTGAASSIVKKTKSRKQRLILDTIGSGFAFGALIFVALKWFTRNNAQKFLLIITVAVFGLFLARLYALIALYLNKQLPLSSDKDQLALAKVVIIVLAVLASLPVAWLFLTNVSTHLFG